MLTLIATDCHGISAVTQELPTRQESLSVLLNDKSLDQELKATWNSEGHQPGTKDSKRNWSKDPTGSVGPGQPLGGWQTTSLIYPDVSCCDVRRSFNEWRRRREQHWMQDICTLWRDIYNYMLFIYIYTSSTAQGGGGSFKNRKPIGEVGCCESGMADRSH